MKVEALRQEAAAWVVRMSEPGCSEADRAAFAAWRGQSPAHEATYEREAAAWERLDRLRALRPGVADADADLLAPVAPPLWQRLPRRRFATAAIVALLVITTVLGTPALLMSPAYATGIGERRLVVLDDGSKVELNTDSKIVVRYRKGVREVELVRGEAAFSIAEDARPFEVVADNARLRAASSAMNVRVKAREVAVTVAEGQVAMLRGTALAGTVTAGMQAIYTPEGSTAQAVTRDKIDRALAWRQGVIDLDGQSLAQAAEEFNRYTTRKLVVQDEAVASLRLGGYFRTDDVDGFVRALRKSFAINPVQMRDGRVLLTRSN